MDAEAASGLVGVLPARDAGRSRGSVSAPWLVDVYCVGGKNDLGHIVIYRTNLPETVRNFPAGG